MDGDGILMSHCEPVNQVAILLHPFFPLHCLLHILSWLTISDTSYCWFSVQSRITNPCHGLCKLGVMLTLVDGVEFLSNRCIHGLQVKFF